MHRWTTIEKSIGETPLEALERARAAEGIPQGTPMAYAGRLDPMASGKLLILIGNECKKQTRYHTLDKEYEFEVLFGISSDTGDVLGLLKYESVVPEVSISSIKSVCQSLSDTVIELPYPHYSSKTVQGKPLHTWAVEGKIDEITIPTNTSKIYRIALSKTTVLAKENLYTKALQKINSIPPVTDKRKVIGNDFRRTDVRDSWKQWYENKTPNEYLIATLTCTSASGTYMRSLAEEIGARLNTDALALSIHRNKIGSYQALPFELGFWKKQF